MRHSIGEGTARASARDVISPPTLKKMPKVLNQLRPFDSGYSADLRFPDRSTVHSYAAGVGVDEKRRGEETGSVRSAPTRGNKPARGGKVPLLDSHPVVRLGILRRSSGHGISCQRASKILLSLPLSLKGKDFKIV